LSAYLAESACAGRRGTDGVLLGDDRRGPGIPVVQFANPAQVFMGDTGSLALGGLWDRGVLIISRLVLVIAGGVFR